MCFDKKKISVIMKTYVIAKADYYHAILASF